MATKHDDIPIEIADALSEAAMIFAGHGIEFCLPWNGDLDDLERERFEALREACAAYAMLTERERKP